MATTGTVSRFDVAVGLGVITTADAVDVGFHCTQIADGTRDIAVGTPVRFSVLAARGGEWEAGAVTALGSG